MSSSAQYFLPYASSGSAAGTGAAPPRVRRWIDAGAPGGKSLPGDYVVERGGLKQDDGFTSKVVLAFATKLGTCQVDPTFGSRFHEIKQADERGRRLAESYGLLAIAHLANEIKDLKVTASLPEDAPGRIDLIASGRKGMEVVSTKYSQGL